LFHPLAVNIGLRYVLSRRSFISFASAISLAGLALAVAVLVFVQAVVAGFEREMNDRVLAIVPHLAVRGYAPVSDYRETLDVMQSSSGVVAAAPIIEGAVLLASDKRVVGVNLTGVAPDEYRAVSRIFDYGAAAQLRAGAFDLLLGSQAAERLGVAVGERIMVVLPEAAVTPLGLFPRQKRFAVAGILRTGSQLDRSLAVVHRDDAARLFRRGEAVDGFHVRAERPLAAGALRLRLLDAVGAHRFRIETWFDSLGNLYSAIGSTKGMLFLLLSLLVAVAAFNLVSSLVMVVNERRGDIAMLRTMGAGTGLSVGAFLTLGVAIAFAGVALGIGAGLGLGAIAEFGFLWLEDALGTRLMGEYFIDELPVAFAPGDIVRVGATAMALCLLATMLPAWRASRLQPALVLRHE
jgi:lipoprotein-releasing system permease protein